MKPKKKNPISKPDLADIYETLFPPATEYMFFSSHTNQS